MTNMNRRKLCGLLVGAFSLSVLSGCGQTGPLYLPEENPEDPDKKKKLKQKLGAYPHAESTRTV